MTDDPLLSRPPWEQGLHAMQRDLLADGGPRISTMRNQRVALCLYPMEEEFALRRRVETLRGVVRRAGWHEREVSLQEAVRHAVERLPPERRASIEARERRFVTGDARRALNYVQDQVTPLLEGPDGVARSVVDAIGALVERHPTQQDRSVVFVTHTWALHPFARVSGLLKHLAGKTHHVSVVIFYPGERRGEGLSLLGVHDADRDYRPRIYP